MERDQLEEMLSARGEDPYKPPVLFDISPNEAERLLAVCKKQRPCRANQIRSLANDMKSGRFYPGNDCILIDSEGNLGNGQHRLNAVMLSGATVKMWIRSNVPKAEIKMIDSGAKRNLTDRTCFMKGDHQLTRQKEAVMKASLTCGWSRPSNLNCSNADLIEFADKHAKALNFVVEECFKGRKDRYTASACVLAVFFRAYYKADHDKLKYAASWLLDGNFGVGEIIQ